jgi:hypothetical protein
VNITNLIIASLLAVGSQVMVLVTVQSAEWSQSWTQRSRMRTVAFFCALMALGLAFYAGSQT